jgi:hypothetical protein
MSWDRTVKHQVGLDIQAPRHRDVSTSILVRRAFTSWSSWLVARRRRACLVSTSMTFAIPATSWPVRQARRSAEAELKRSGTQRARAKKKRP